MLVLLGKIGVGLGLALSSFGIGILATRPAPRWWALPGLYALLAASCVGLGLTFAARDQAERDLEDARVRLELYRQRGLELEQRRPELP